MNRPKRVQFLGRPPVKSTKACAMAKRKGELEAETKFYDKQPLLKKLKRLLWKKIEEVDPLKTAAILAGTITVYNFIATLDQKTKERILRWEISSILAGPIFGTVINVGWNAFEDINDLEIVYEDIDVATGVSPDGEKYVTKTSTPVGFRKRGSADKPQKVLGWSNWLFAFFVAYIIVEHGGEIFGMMIDGGKGLGSMVTALVGST